MLRPVEGTILTVVRAAAEAVERALGDGETTLVGVLERAAAAARDAVAQHPRPAAGAARGGRRRRRRARASSCCSTRASHVVDGTPLPAPEVGALRRRGRGARRRAATATSPTSRYEVMYFLEAPTTTHRRRSRTAWGALGDSIVVVGGDGLWNCHVHTDDIGAAIEAGIDGGPAARHPRHRPARAGRGPRRGRVGARGTGGRSRRRRSTRVDHRRWSRSRSATALARLLASLGVQQVVAGGQSMNPSTAQILEAVERVRRRRRDRAAEQQEHRAGGASRCADLTDRPVAVVPTAAVVEALAALVAYDPDASLDDNAAAMAEAAARVRAGEVTQAVRDSVAECGPIADGRLDRASRATASASRRSRRSTPRSRSSTRSSTTTASSSPSLVGADADAADTDAHRASTSRCAHPDVEVEVHDGGQPLYPYLIGVE